MGQRFAVLVGCIAAVLVSALPAAANNEPTTGTRIGLYQPPATFAANSPFYIEHGFACGLGDSSCIAQQISANATFDLYLDGALQPSTVDVDRFGGGLEKQHLTNYASGLPAGTHTFVGVWTQNGTVVLIKTATITFA